MRYYWYIHIHIYSSAPGRKKVAAGGYILSLLFRIVMVDRDEYIYICNFYCGSSFVFVVVAAAAAVVVVLHVRCISTYQFKTTVLSKCVTHAGFDKMAWHEPFGPSGNTFPGSKLDP